MRYKPERREGGTGGVLRGSNGVFIAAAYSFIEHVVDAPTAEVHALREGVLREGVLLAQHILVVAVSSSSRTVWRWYRR